MSVTLAYADWCGHCQKLKPTWDVVKQEFKGSGLKVVELNADKDQTAMKKLGIQGFPTIFYLTKSGEKKEYTGDRSKASLAAFFKEAQGQTGGSRGVRGRQVQHQSGGGDAQVYQNLSIISAAIAGYFYYLSTLVV